MLSSCYRHNTNIVDHCTWYETLTIGITCIVASILWHITLLFMSHWYTDIPKHGLSYYCDHRYMDAWYTVTSCSYIIVTHIYWYTCIDWIMSVFLLYGPSFIVHVLLEQVYSDIPVTWLCPVMDIGIPVTGHECCWYVMCGTKCHVDPSHGGHL